MEITKKLLRWAECLLADIEAGAVEYEDGTTYDPEYVDRLRADIDEAKKELGL